MVLPLGNENGRQKRILVLHLFKTKPRACRGLTLEFSLGAGRAGVVQWEHWDVVTAQQVVLWGSSEPDPESRGSTNSARTEGPAVQGGAAVQRPCAGWGVCLRAGTGCVSWADSEAVGYKKVIRWPEVHSTTEDMYVIRNGFLKRITDHCQSDKEHNLFLWTSSKNKITLF